MTKEKRPWTENEFKAYILLSAAQTNFDEAYEQQEMILEYVDAKTSKRLHREIADDNDYQVAQKILAYVKENQYTEEQVDALLHEIKELFESDGDYDNVEQNYMVGLHRLLETAYRDDFTFNSEEGEEEDEEDNLLG